MQRHPFGLWLRDKLTARSLTRERQGLPALTLDALVAELRQAGRSATTAGVRAWMDGRARPRDEDRPALANILGLSRSALAAACAGTHEDGSPLPPWPAAPSTHSSVGGAATAGGPTSTRPS